MCLVEVCKQQHYAQMHVSITSWLEEERNDTREKEIPGNQSHWNWTQRNTHTRDWSNDISEHTHTHARTRTRTIKLKHTYLGQYELSVNHTPTPRTILKAKRDNPESMRAAQTQRAARWTPLSPASATGGQQPISSRRRFRSAPLWPASCLTPPTKHHLLYSLPR